MRRTRALAGIRLRAQEHQQQTLARRFNSTQAGAPAQAIPTEDSWRMDRRPTPKTYGAILEEIYTVNDRMHVKQGLDNIERLNQAIGDPAGALNCVHVTGTNGKGSVCWKISEAFRFSGKKTGLFVSPHVSSFRERVRINQQLITEEEVVKHMTYILERAAAENIPATFFEFATALGMHYFASNNTDVVVLEVGLGGRLDSTNIIKSPLATIVTNIGLEHTRILGNTVEEIAHEKGCIAKTGSPMLIGPHVPLEPLEKICAERGAPLHVLTPPATTSGDYDVENVAMARAALELMGQDIKSEAVVEALKQRPPCRFEIIPQRQDSVYVLDAGHNAPALKVLFASLDARMQELRQVTGAGPQDRLHMQLVLALSADKDLEGCGEAVAAASEHFDEIICTQASTIRAQSPETIRSNITNALSDLSVKGATVSVAGSVEDALSMADANSSQAHLPSVTVVCGSIFMMTEVRRHLQMDFPQDPLAHQATPAKN